MMRTLSLLYQWACRIIRRLYHAGVLKIRKAPLPVISVGNIVFGGSGKTPLVQILLDYLSSRDYKPALVSRGYGGHWEKTGGTIPPGGQRKFDWRDTGDEPCLIARNHPGTGIFIGKDKLASCRKAREDGYDIAVLDDGFQHYRLFRDVDIVLHSLKTKALKREPVSSLKWADIVLLEKEGPSQKNGSLERKAGKARVYSYAVKPNGILHAGTGKPVSPQELKNIPVLAFCGIARPQRFRNILKEAGVMPQAFLAFPDHHPYTPSSIRKIMHHLRSSGSQAGLTTEKDLVKLQSLISNPGFQLWVIKIRMEIDSAFYQDLGQRLDSLAVSGKQ
jgi:tetraacyldisaccharide 4'-kinase